MTLTRTFPTDRAAGLPLADTRLLVAAMVESDTTGKLRAGVLPSHYNPLVTGTAGMAYQVAAFAAVTARAGMGAELVANDGAATVATTAAPGANSRIDVIWVRSLFTTTGDAGTDPVFGVTQGAAAASPLKPSIPAGALELATAVVLSTTTQTSTAVITQTHPYTAMEGGTVALRNQAEQDAWTPADGAMAYRLDSKVLRVRTNGSWRNASSAQYLITSGSFRDVTSLDIDGIFQPVFGSVIIEIDLDMISAKSVVYARLRSGGVTETNNGYFYQLLFGASGSANAVGLNSQNRWQLTTLSGDNAKIRVDVSGAEAVRRTLVLFESLSWDTAVGPVMHRAEGAAAHGTNAPYDGFQLSTDGSPKMSGRYRVYGNYSEA